MTVYTMGFTQKTSKIFFELIKKNHVQILIDVRLNNSSQLAGFTKGQDLEYFLSEICHCEYSHEVAFAPTKEILDAYKKKIINWGEYTSRYLDLIETRAVEKRFIQKYESYDRVLFLCAESTPEQCHRRLLSEYLCEKTACNVVHL